MAKKQFCDYCGSEIPLGKRDDGGFNVAIFDRTKDADTLNRDACGSCIGTIKRLLNKSRDRLDRALEAASDK